jgi:hypothetical protein
VKNKLIILFFILSLGFYTKAQNLVNNGGFEIYSQCPNGTAEFNYVTNWIIAGGTPDYFNACVGVGANIDVPYSEFGYQQDCCGGEGYAGIYVFNKPFPNDAREYIQLQLNDTLRVGKKYIASMYVSKVDGYDYAIASMGMLFTDTLIHAPTSANFINANPQVKNITLLSDTLNWTLIQDTITAIGGELYLTIGNFSFDSLSDTAKVGGNGTFFGAAYYYIDGVSVYDLETVGIKQNKNIEINIYPNPNNGSMTLEYSINNDARLEIMDITSTLVGTYNLPVTSNTIQIKNDNLQNGIYLYRVISNNAVIKQGKIVVMQ